MVSLSELRVVVAKASSVLLKTKAAVAVEVATNVWLSVKAAERGCDTTLVGITSLSTNRRIVVEESAKGTWSQFSLHAIGRVSLLNHSWPLATSLVSANVDVAKTIVSLWQNWAPVLQVVVAKLGVAEWLRLLNILASTEDILGVAKWLRLLNILLASTTEGI